MAPEETLLRLQTAKVVAVVRAPDQESLAPTVDALLAGGVRSIEVTLTSPGAIASLPHLRTLLPPDATLGVGTVLRPEEARHAVENGADFIVAPVLDPQVVRTAQEAGALVAPGAYTPTEILQAWSLGAQLVKVFPANQLGPAFIRSLLAPLPFLRLMPTGGIEPENIPDWLKAGAFALGAGSSLVSTQLIREANYAQITANAHRFTQSAQL